MTSAVARFARVSLIATLLVAAGAVAEARPLFNASYDCGDGKTAYFFIVEDDCTGVRYSVFVDCNGNMCVQWLAGWGNYGTLSAPSNLESLVNSADFVTPSIFCGVYFNWSLGGTLQLINPANSAERADILDMWEDEQEGTCSGIN